MINSMTAFAADEATEGTVSVSTEIRSYNSRYLDITLRAPRVYICLENRIKQLISKKIDRGRVEIKLAVKNDADEANDFEVNLPTAHAYQRALMQLNNDLDLGSEISLEMILGAEGVVKPALIETDTESLWPVISRSMERAADLLYIMRNREGEYICQDFKNRLDYIEKNIEEIESKTEDLLDLYQERLKKRIIDLTKGVLEIDPVRIAQEAAILADKSDVSEEILRVKSHIKQFRIFMDSQEPAGRKLNFLLQEFNREFNTIGSKTDQAQISHMVVDIKSELEKLREQVQNVE